MRTIVMLAMLLCSASLWGQEQYEIKVNLKKVKFDRVMVEVKPPTITNATAEYVMPTMIPGSYSTKDFGRFVVDFKALDAKGKPLPVEKEGENVYKISNATALDKITYWVDDTWDAPNNNFIFQPGGTNIEMERNFTINHQGFYGYIEGKKMVPYEITYIKPKHFYAATPLRIERGKKSDKAFAPNYVNLVDNPIMYSLPDTTSFMAGNMRVHISVYSQTNKVKAAQVSEIVQPLAKALEHFFGTLPVDHYHFIMYFPKFSSEGVAKYGGFGALEHSHCSFYFLPEITDQERLVSMIQGVAGHEFLHILTPLNIHSEEIEYFDFRHPKMSQHLWMYEGVTEYFSNLIQVQDGLMTYHGFMEEITNKVKRADKYITDNEGKVVSFTDMSKNILADEYKDMYSNVYQKGAMIGFLLDIRLRELSKGQHGLRELMLDLAKKYGPSKPFQDDMLIRDIIALSAPEIANFFEQYVVGDTPLPYREYFEKIGWEYWPEKEDTVDVFGDFEFMYDSDTKHFTVVKTLPEKNEFGFKNFDEVLEVNGEVVSLENYSGLIKLTDGVVPNKEVEVKVKRGEKQLLLNAVPVKELVTIKHLLEEVDEPSAQQLELRKQVLQQ